MRIKKIPNFFFFLFLLVFFLNGCGSSQVSFIEDKNIVYTDNIIKINISDTNINKTQSISTQEIIVQTGIYNKSEFVLLTDEFEKKENDFYVYLTDKNLENNNIVVRILYNNNLFYEVLPAVYNGTNELYIQGNNSNYKANILKVLSNYDEYENISLGEILSFFPFYKISQSSYSINKAPKNSNNDDVFNIVRAFVNLERKIMDYSEEIGFSKNDYKTIKKYSHKLTREIMKDLRKGVYSDEKSAWESYDHQLQTWAFSNDFDTEKVELIFIVRDLEQEDMIEEIDNGNITVIDQDGNSVQMPITGSEFIELVTQIKENSSKKASKLSFYIKELIQLKDDLEEFENITGEDLELEIVNYNIDDFLTQMQEAKLHNNKEVESYYEYAGYQTRKYISIAFGKILLYSLENDMDKLNALFSSYIQNYGVLENKVDESIQYSDLYLYKDEIDNFSSVLHIKDLIRKYIEKNTDHSEENKAQNIDEILTIYTNTFREEFNKIVKQAGIEWTDNIVNKMADLYSRMNSLQIEQPLSLIPEYGEMRTVKGRIDYGFFLDDEFNFYNWCIRDVVTNKIICNVRNWNENDEISAFQRIMYSGMYNMALVTEDGLIQNPMSIPDLNDFLNNDEKLFVLCSYFPGTPVLVYPALNYNFYEYIGSYFEFDCWVKPPRGVWKDGEVEDLSIYNSQPFSGVICSIKEISGFSLKDNIGEHIKDITVCFDFSEEENRFYMKSPDNIDKIDKGSPESQDIYWIADFNGAVLKFDGEESSFKIEDISETSFYSVTGNILEEKQDNNKRVRIFKVSSVFKIYDKSWDNKKIYRPSFTGKLIYGDYYSSKKNFKIVDSNGFNNVIAEIMCDDYTINSWFYRYLGQVVTLGDKDPYNDYDGITYSDIDCVWDDEKNIPVITVDENMEDAWSSNKPDWAIKYSY